MLQKLLDKFFPVEFHVRVVQHSTGSNWYCVEYSYSRFPTWVNVEVFLSHCGRLNRIVGTVHEAEKLAESFKTIDDVLAFQAIENDKLSKSYPDRPYKVKNIL